MKNQTMARRLTVIGALVFLAGLIVFGAAFALSGFDLNNLSTRPPYTEQNYTYQSGNLDLVLVDNNTPVTVGTSPDDKIHLTCFESEKEWYEVEETETELRIVKKDSFTWMDYVMVMDFRPRSLTLLLPKGYLGAADLRTSNADLTVKDQSFKSTVLTSSNGKIAVENTTADGLEARSSNNSVTLKGVKAGKLDIDSSNGSVTLTDVTGTEMIMKTSNNGVRLTNVTGESLSATSSNGGVTAKDVSVSGAVRLETSNNRIALENLDAGVSVWLKSSNGGISGTLAGKMSDFSIRSDTSNGDSNLPTASTDGAKTLEAKTSNGNISIEFAG